MRSQREDHHQQSALGKAVDAIGGAALFGVKTAGVAYGAYRLGRGIGAGRILDYAADGSRKLNSALEATSGVVEGFMRTIDSAGWKETFTGRATNELRENLTSSLRKWGNGQRGVIGGEMLRAERLGLDLRKMLDYSAEEAENVVRRQKILDKVAKTPGYNPEIANIVESLVSPGSSAFQAGYRIQQPGRSASDVSREAFDRTVRSQNLRKKFNGSEQDVLNQTLNNLRQIMSDTAERKDFVAQYGNEINTGTKKLQAQFVEAMLSNANKTYGGNEHQGFFAKVLAKAGPDATVRRATYRDLYTHAENPLDLRKVERTGQSSRAFFESLRDRVSEIDPRLASRMDNMVVDPNLYIGGAKDRLIDMRGLVRGADRLTETLGREIQVPFVGIRPLSLMRPFVPKDPNEYVSHIFNPGSVINTGKTFAAQSRRTAYYAGQMLNLDYKDGQLVVDVTKDVYLTRFGAHRRALMNMDPTSRYSSTFDELAHDPRLRSRFRNVFDLGMNESRGFVGNVLSIATKFSDPTWTRNMVSGLENGSLLYHTTGYLQGARAKSVRILEQKAGTLTRNQLIEAQDLITKRFGQDFFNALTTGSTEQSTMNAIESLIQMKDASSLVGKDQVRQLERYLAQYKANPDIFSHIKNAHEELNESVLDNLGNAINLRASTPVRYGDKYRQDLQASILHAILPDTQRSTIASVFKGATAGDITDILDLSLYGRFSSWGDDTESLRQMAGFISGKNYLGQQNILDQDARARFIKIVDHAEPVFGFGPQPKPSSVVGAETPVLIRKSNVGDTLIRGINDNILNGSFDLKDPLSMFGPIGKVAGQTLNQLYRESGFGGAGRAGRGNLDQVTEVTTAFYNTFNRLNEYLEAASFGLSKRHTGSAQDLALNLVGRRYILPAMMLGYMVYGNDLIGNITGTEPTDAAVQGYAGISLGVQKVKDVTGLNSFGRWMERLTPGSEQLWGSPMLSPLKWASFGLLGDNRGYEELYDYYTTGNEPVRRGRWWEFGSNTPWTGGRVMGFRPSFYRRALGEPTMTDSLWGSENEYWANNALPTLHNPLGPIKTWMLDPYHWERCVTEDTPILQPNGQFKPAGEIAIRDKVVSFTGETVNVLEVWHEYIDEEIIEVRPYTSSTLPIRTTREHRYLAVSCQPCVRSHKTRKRNCYGTKSSWCSKCKNKPVDNYIADWVRADELKAGDMLLYPIQKLEERERVTFVLEPVGSNKPTRDPMYRAIDLTEDLARLIGYYISEGHIQGGRVAIFSLAADEEFIAHDIANIINRIFGTKARVYQPSPTKYSVSACNVRLAKFLSMVAGNGAANKFIHEDILKAKRSVLENLIKGLFLGDGTHKSHENQCSYHTISKQLASQIRELLISMRIGAPTISVIPANNTNTHRRNNQERYDIIVCGPGNNLIREIVGWPIEQEDSWSARNYYFNEDFLYIKIREINVVHFNGNIVDLKVEKNFSFTTFSATLHNTHYNDQPTPVYGGIPEFQAMPIIGPALDSTVGRVFKPIRTNWRYFKDHRQYIKEINEAIKADEEQRSRGSILYHTGGGRMTFKGIPDELDVEVGPNGEVLGGSGGIGDYGMQGLSAGTGLSPVYMPLASGSGAATTAQTLRGINLGLTDVKNLRGLGSRNLNDLVQSNLLDRIDSVSSPYNLLFQGNETMYQVRELMGLRGFALGQLFGEDFGKPDMVLQSSSRAYGYERRFWDQQMGGLGGDFSEAMRRFLPHRQRDVQEYNPMQNNMPDWLPSNLDYFQDYQHGNPSLVVPFGESMLPGEGYESINKLHPDAYFGRYGAIDRMRILANAAPWSEQYKYYSRVVSQMHAKGLYTEDEYRLAQRARDEARLKKQKYRFYGYKFKDNEIDRDTVTIDRMIDPFTFTTVERPGEVFRLAGISGPKSPDTEAGAEVNALASQYLQAGQRVTVGVSRDPVGRVRRDTLGTTRAVVWSNGVKVNKALLDAKGVKADYDSTDPASIHALYNPLERTIGSAWESIAHLDNPINCVAPFTEIITEEGIVKAGDLIPGMKVLTHMGNFKEVVEVAEQPAGKTIYSVKLSSSTIPLVATYDHPVLAVRHVRKKRGISHGTGLYLEPYGNDPKPEFVQMKDLRPYDFVVYKPRKMENLSTKIIVDMMSICGDRFVYDDENIYQRNNKGSVNPKPLGKRFIKITSDVARLLGYYAAEGCLAATRGKLGYTDFTFHANETEYIEDVCRIVSAMGFPYRLVTKNNTSHVVIGSAILASFFNYFVGRKKAKRAPDEILNNNAMRAEFIRGLLRGDGTKNGYCRYDTIGMVALQLLSWLKDALFNLWGIPAVLSDGIRCKPSYVLHIGAWPQLVEFIDGTTVYEPCFFEQTIQARSRCRVGEYILYRIQSVDIAEYQGVTIDVEVDGDDTFATLNANVHNTKFLHVRSPLEMYERNFVYGKEFQSWDHPISDWLVPTINKMSKNNPLVATGTGALLGSMFVKSKHGKVIGAAVGGTVGLVGTGGRVLNEAIGRIADPLYTWIPAEERRIREVEEYFDMLKYVKFKGLYERAARAAYKYEGLDVDRLLDQMENGTAGNKSEVRRLQKVKRMIKLSMGDTVVNQEDAKARLEAINQRLNELTGLKEGIMLGPIATQAIQYKQQYEQTLAGADPNGDLANILAALPKRDRAFFQEFMNAKPEEREKILRLVPKNQRRFYQAKWGMKVDRQQNPLGYFLTHNLPGASWHGWEPDADLDEIKLKFINQEGMDLDRFGAWESEMSQVDENTPELSHMGGFILDTFKLKDVLEGRGISNLDIYISSEQTQDPTSPFTIDLQMAHDRRPDVVDLLNKNISMLLR